LHFQVFQPNTEAAHRGDSSVEPREF
jgi:hypothetical protein